MDRALKAKQREEQEDLLSSQGLLYADTIHVRQQQAQEEGKRILVAVGALRLKIT